MSAGWKSSAAVGILAAQLLAGCTDDRGVPTAAETADVNAAIAEAATTLITEVQVRTGQPYVVASGGLAAGARRLIDRSNTIVAPVPAEVAGHPFIRTAHADRSASPGEPQFLGLRVSQNVVVYVAHDNRLPRPGWLSSGWTDTGQNLWDSGSTPEGLRLFRRSFPAGLIILGSNVRSAGDAGTMYTVIVRPASTGGGSPAVNECATPKPGWIWCDDFEQDRMRGYFEYSSRSGSFVRAAGVGAHGSTGMRVRWAPRQVNAGSLKLAFGRTPDAYIRPVDAGTAKYREIYWRIYVRNQPGWVGGGGNKLARATSLVSKNWAQSMAAVVGSGGSGERYLRINPTSGTDAAGNLRTTRYNDFDNFRRLGQAVGTTPIFSGEHLGRWHCVEAHTRLNDPGLANGVFRLWINGQKETERTNLNWVGAYTAYGINAVFFENYWNNGSPTSQERYFDNIVVSTQRIGC